MDAEMTSGTVYFKHFTQLPKAGNMDAENCAGKKPPSFG